jgi:hypothetical protein
MVGIDSLSQILRGNYYLGDPTVYPRPRIIFFRAYNPKKGGFL